MLEEKQNILAMGAGGATKIVEGDLIRRVENVKDIRSYIERIDEMIARKMKETDKYGSKEVSYHPDGSGE